MFVHVLLTHMVRGVGVEVTGTEHVATARFDITGGHVEIGFGRFLLRGRREVDKTGGERKERKQNESRQTTHDPSNGFVKDGPNRELRNSTPGVWRIQRISLLSSKTAPMYAPSRTFRPTLQLSAW
jgi:hypothetical protein